MEMPAHSRRVFLRRSLGAVGALAALPGLGVGCAPADLARAPAGLQTLDAAEWALLDAVSDAIVPRGGAFALGARDVALAQRIDGFLANESPAVQSGVAGALLAVEWVAPLAAGRVARFSRLDDAGRVAAIDALRTSRIALLRDVYAGLKQLCVFGFYAVDASWAATGYDGPLVGRAAAR